MFTVTLYYRRIRMEWKQSLFFKYTTGMWIKCVHWNSLIVWFLFLATCKSERNNAQSINTYNLMHFQTKLASLMCFSWQEMEIFFEETISCWFCIANVANPSQLSVQLHFNSYFIDRNYTICFKLNECAKPEKMKRIQV